jgi:hypothetical protein
MTLIPPYEYASDHMIYSILIQPKKVFGNLRDKKDISAYHGNSQRTTKKKDKEN